MERKRGRMGRAFFFPEMVLYAITSIRIFTGQPVFFSLRETGEYSSLTCKKDMTNSLVTLQCLYYINENSMPLFLSVVLQRVNVTKIKLIPTFEKDVLWSEGHRPSCRPWQNQLNGVHLVPRWVTPHLRKDSPSTGSEVLLWVLPITR